MTLMTHATVPLQHRLLTATLLWAGAVASAGAAPLAGQVFTCVAANGRTLTSDRLIAECIDREQRVLSGDGTLLRIVPPTLTADERAEKEARERKAIAEREAKAEAVRRDRNLLLRYPSEQAHQWARDAAMADIRTSIQLSELRQRELIAERKPLLDEAEFYKDKPLPAKLRQQIDANEAAAAAQQDAQSNQKAELERVTRLFDAELARLKRLWAGAPPGSLGAATVEATSAPSPAAPTGKPVAVRIDKK
jgi:hypothetical protein